LADRSVSWRLFLGDNFSNKLFINHFGCNLSRIPLGNFR
jgi:hypothetical protein